MGGRAEWRAGEEGGVDEAAGGVVEEQGKEGKANKVGGRWSWW